jgi:hypothetical protein
MGEKEIRPGYTLPGDKVAPAQPKAPIPQTTEKAGTGSAPSGADPNAPQDKASFDAAVAKSEAAAKSGPYEKLFKDGWSEGRDAAGYNYAIDPNGVQGVWNPTTKQFLDPNTGKPYPSGWGSGHKP